MHYIVYLSTSSKLYTNDELLDLLAKSRANNAKAGITGMLMYNQGTFFQAIEGEKADVFNLYEKINNDSRHHNVIKLKSGELSHRNFPDTSLGFTSSYNKDYTALQDFLRRDAATVRGDYGILNPPISLLRSFAMNNFLQFKLV